MKKQLFSASMPLLVSIILTGCLGKLERLTEETKDKVGQSVTALHDVENNQGLAGTTVMLGSPDLSPHARYSAAKKLFFDLTKEMDVHSSIGAKYPLPTFMMIPTWSVPNVTIVAEQQDAFLSLHGILPVNRNTYLLMEGSVMGILTGLKGQLQLPENQREPMDRIIAITRKMLYISPTILGAREWNPTTRSLSAAPFRESALPEGVKDPHNMARVCAARALEGLVSALDASLDADIKEHVKTAIDAKMKVSPSDVCDEEALVPMIQ